MLGVVTRALDVVQSDVATAQEAQVAGRWLAPGDDGEDPHLQLGLHAVYLGVPGDAAFGGRGVLLVQRPPRQVGGLLDEAEHPQYVAGDGTYRLGKRAPVGAGGRAHVHDGHDSQRRPR